jgi:glycine cleavage system transcriptional repressor
MKGLKNGKMFDWVVVSVVGSDRPGIVANVSRVLYENHYNIESLSQTVIMGQFAMILIASTQKGKSHERIRSGLSELENRLSLDIHLKQVGPEEMASYRSGEMEPFVITVRGEDRPGLAYGISEILAEWGINITSLDAKVALLGETLEYIQIFQVDIPKELDFGLIQEKLRQQGEEMGVIVDLQHLEIFRAINQI